MNAHLCNTIFEKSIIDYHVPNNVDTELKNPYQANSIEALLYHKNWIDTVQWHLEDIIRSPQLPAEELVKIKRRIDASNQERTDLVEKIDDWFLSNFSNANRDADARMNSETPAWLVDRMSILALKIYHMKEQTQREDVSKEHKDKCQVKLRILLEQKQDLATCLDELMEDIRTGKKYMKVYRQMKMYNDTSLNPVLYGQKINR